MYLCGIKLQNVKYSIRFLRCGSFVTSVPIICVCTAGNCKFYIKTPFEKPADISLTLGVNVSLLNSILIYTLVC